MTVLPIPPAVYKTMPNNGSSNTVTLMFNARGQQHLTARQVIPNHPPLPVNTPTPASYTTTVIPVSKQSEKNKTTLTK